MAGKRTQTISEEKRNNIAKMYRTGEKISYIAELHGVSSGAVSRIAKVAGMSRGRGTRQISLNAERAKL